MFTGRRGGEELPDLVKGVSKPCSYTKNVAKIPISLWRIYLLWFIKLFGGKVIIAAHFVLAASVTDFKSIMKGVMLKYEYLLQQSMFCQSTMAHF